MNIVDYQQRHLVDLTNLYNDLVQPVPHCYPIGAKELAGAFAGKSGSEFDDRSLTDDVIFVAVDDGRPLGFVHVGEGFLGEGGIKGVDAVIRFLAYPRGHRDVGQRLLAQAVAWAKTRQLPAITAFPQTYRYPFYGFAHTYVSGFLAHIHALFLINGFEFSGGEVYLDWVDFEPPPVREAPEIAFELVTKRWESDGPLPNIRVNARHEGENIGECLLWSASRFTCTDAVDDFTFCQWLGVEEPFQGKGLGAHLLGAALHEAKRAGYRHAGISTEFSNHRALLFYSNFGFQAVDWTRRFRRVLAE